MGDEIKRDNDGKHIVITRDHDTGIHNISIGNSYEEAFATAGTSGYLTLDGHQIVDARHMETSIEFKTRCSESVFVGVPVPLETKSRRAMPVSCDTCLLLWHQLQARRRFRLGNTP